jgi:hypothetical protein
MKFFLQMPEFHITNFLPVGICKEKSDIIFLSSANLWVFPSSLEPNVLGYNR